MQSRQLGLSVVELVIVIMIASILLAKGVPAFTDYLSNEKFRAIADEYQVGLQHARMAAISRNTVVRFVPNGDGWQVVVPAVGANPQTVLASRGQTQNNSNIAVTPSGVNVSFNGQGRIVSGGLFSVGFAGPAGSTCVQSGGAIRCLRVNVTTAGQIKLCDPAAAANNPVAC